MTIPLRNLRSFIAVASAGSISKAAKVVHIAQPALSAHIQQVEEVLGTPVFERVHRGVTLTPAGERFLSHAEEILRHVDRAIADVRNAVGEPSGRVAIGLPQSMAQLIGVPLVKAVVEQYPRVRLQLVELNTGYVPESLLARKIDLGMTFRSEERTGVSYKLLLNEELVFVSSSSHMARYHPHRLQRASPIRAADLQSFPIVMPAREHSLRRHIDESMTKARVVLNVIAEVNAVPQLVELAAAEVGSTFLSRTTIERHPSAKDLIISPIVHPVLTRPVYLCHASAYPMSIAVDVVAELIESLVISLSS